MQRNTFKSKLFTFSLMKRKHIVGAMVGFTAIAFFGTAFYTSYHRTEILQDSQIQYLHSLEHLRNDNGLEYLSHSVRESVHQDLDAKIKEAKTAQVEELLSQESRYRDLYGGSLFTVMVVALGLMYYAKPSSFNDEVHFPSFR